MTFSGAFEKAKVYWTSTAAAAREEVKTQGQSTLKPQYNRWDKFVFVDMPYVLRRAPMPMAAGFVAVLGYYWSFTFNIEFRMSLRRVSENCRGSVLPIRM